MSSSYNISGGDTVIEILQRDESIVDYNAIQILSSGLNDTITVSLQQSLSGEEFHTLPSTTKTIEVADTTTLLQTNAYKLNTLYLKIVVGGTTTGVLNWLTTSKPTNLPLLLEDAFIFGANYQYIEDDTESFNATDTPVSKLLLTTPVIPAGKYRAQANAEVSNSSTAGKVGLIIEVDSVEENNILKEPKDIDDTLNWSPFASIDFTTGVHTLEILFYNEGSGTASIKNARLEIFRVQ